MTTPLKPMDREAWEKRVGHPTPLQDAPTDTPKNKVYECPTCSTRLVMSEKDAQNMLCRATPPGFERVPEGTMALLIKTQYSVYNEEMGQYECAFCPATARKPHNPDCEMGRILTAHRATPSILEAVPEGLDLDKLSATLSSVCTYIEKHEDLRPYSSLTPGKGLHTEILFIIAAIAAHRAAQKGGV